MLFGEDVACGTLRVAVFVGIVKESQLVLGFEDAAAGRVEGLHAYLARHDGLFERAHKSFAHHIHIYPGIEGTGGNCLQGADAMFCHLGYAGKVGHYKAVEAPLLAKHIGHQPFVGCGRYAVYLVERRHYTAHTCLYGGLIGVHIFVEHAVAAHVYRVVVAARFACPVEGEVLDAGKDFIVALELVGEVGSLITVYHRFGNCSAKERVFATAFADTSPTRVAADVHHRTECPGDAVGTGFDGGNTCGFPNGCHIPGAGKSQRDGEDGFVTVYHIHAEEQGNAQTGVFHCQLLHVAYLVHSFQVEKSADEPLLDFLGYVTAFGLPGSDFTGNGQVQLPYFLLYGHSLHQGIDKAVHILRRFLRLHGGGAYKGGCK